MVLVATGFGSRLGFVDLRARVRTRLAHSQVERAAEHFRLAIEILAGIKNELDLAGCYRAYAAFRQRTGDVEDAAKLRKRAQEIFGRLRGAASTE